MGAAFADKQKEKQRAKVTAEEVQFLYTHTQASIAIHNTYMFTYISLELHFDYKEFVLAQTSHRVVLPLLSSSSRFFLPPLHCPDLCGHSLPIVLIDLH